MPTRHLRTSFVPQMGRRSAKIANRKVRPPMVGRLPLRSTPSPSHGLQSVSRDVTDLQAPPVRAYSPSQGKADAIKAKILGRFGKKIIQV